MKKSLKTIGVDEDYALKDFAITKLSHHRIVAETTALFKMHPPCCQADLKAQLPSAHVPGGTTQRLPPAMPCHSSGLTWKPWQEPPPVCCNNMKQYFPLLLLETSHQVEYVPQEEKRLNKPLLSMRRNLKLKDFKHTQNSILYISKLLQISLAPWLFVHEACIFKTTQE